MASSRSATELGFALLQAGDLDEARRIFEKESAAHPESAAGRMGLAAISLRQDDFAGAEREYRRLVAGAAPLQREGYRGLSWASAFRGRYREAVHHLDEMMAGNAAEGDATELASAYGQQALWLALASKDFDALQGRVERGLSIVRAATEPAIDHRHFFWFAFSAALARDHAELADDLASRAANLGRNHYDAVLAALHARHAGDDDRARRLVSTGGAGLPSDGLEPFEADWALSERRYEDAIRAATAAEGRPFTSHPDVMGFRASYYPRILLIRAKAHLALAHREEGRRDLDRLLAIWSEADRGAPAVEEARALHRRLARSPSGVARAP